jgi:hypothetical protein
VYPRQKQIECIERHVAAAKANPLRHNEIEAYESALELFKMWQREESKISGSMENNENKTQINQ